jgi:FkbM family methyltransferase
MKGRATKWERALQLASQNPRMFLGKALREPLKPIGRRVGPRTGWTRTVGGVRFFFDPDYAPATVAMWAGSYEYELVRRVRERLPRGGTFLDVGSNIGYIAAVGAGCVGPGGHVHAFEPVPRLLAKLRELAANNPAYRIHINDFALGTEAGTAEIRTAPFPLVGWNTMLPGAIADHEAREIVTIRVRRLDDYLAEAGVAHVDLVKVDVEGYEIPVLLGMQGFFEASPSRPPIIMELAPGGAAKLGHDLGAFQAYLGSYGYRARRLTDLAPIDIRGVETTTDLIFEADT